MKFLKAIRHARPAAGLGLVGLALVLGAAATLPALADDSDSGSNPTIGTLPMVGGGGNDLFDQTVTIRGANVLLRSAVLDASGRGMYGVAQLPGHESWLRFYGDVRVEFDLDAMARLDLGICAGFEGNGLLYAIETSAGIGSTHALAPGEELMIDPFRLLHSGLLDEPITVHALHRDGTRTRTILEYRASEGSLVTYQDI